MKRPLRILIVDDNRQMTHTLTDTFLWKVMSSQRPGPAHRLSKQSVRNFRQIRAIHPEIPLLLMSAHATDDVLRAGLERALVERPRLSLQAAGDAGFAA